MSEKSAPYAPSLTSSMFSCIGSTDTVIQGGEVAGDTLDKILEEAAKLKRRCKSLRTILAETESQRKEEKDTYDKTIDAMRMEYETSIANIKAQNYIEIFQAQESKSREVQELVWQLQAAQNEMTLQGSLIMSLTKRMNVRNTEESAYEPIQLPSERAAAAAEAAQAAENAQNIEIIAEALHQQLESAKLHAVQLAAELSSCRDENNRLQNAALHSMPTDSQRGREYSTMVTFHPDSYENNSSNNNHNNKGGEVGTARPALNRLGRKKSTTSVKNVNTESTGAGTQESELLHKAKEEIADLKATIRELVRTKQSVEESVRTVLSDNETLSLALEAANEQIQSLVALRA